jgi:hypothetical protein
LSSTARLGPALNSYTPSTSISAITDRTSLFGRGLGAVIAETTFAAFGWPQVQVHWHNFHLDWGHYAQIAGVGGFTLALFALWRSMREGKRQHQRKLRDDLRHTYYDIEKHLRDASRTLTEWKSSSTAPISTPPDMQEELDELRRLSFGSIKAPRGKRIRFYRYMLNEHIEKWSGMHSNGATFQQDTDEGDSLSNHNDYFLLHIVRAEIRKLNRIDNGSFGTYLSLRLRRH